jgi:SAM-dependent methyltransferase
MIEILDPLELDVYMADDGLLDRIKDHSLLPSKRIGWNYCFDYVWLALRFEEALRACANGDKPRVVDIGCGPGAVHGYLEEKYGIDIIGVDLFRWDDGDFVDIVGNYSDRSFRAQNDLSDIDIIISTSAFEHNKPKMHAVLVRECLSSLAEKGKLITTFSVAGGKKIEPFKASAQWNLPVNIIEEIYGESVANASQYRDICARWKTHELCSQGYIERYGGLTENFPTFLSIGASIGKQNLANQKIRSWYF